MSMPIPLPRADALVEVASIEAAVASARGVGSAPVDPEGYGAWAEQLRDLISLQRAAAELRRAVADADKAELELAVARRRDAETRSEAGHDLTYTFYDEVNEVTVRAAMATLGAWSRREPGADLRIVLNSPGGRVLDGLALVDFLTGLRRAGHHLRIEVLGRAASMGGVVLQAADERVMGANSFLLVHEVSGGAEGRSSELGDRVEFYEQMERRIVALLSSRSQLTERQIRSRWTRKDWWLGAQEAVAVGLADAVA
jgi:ATP-dependent protease ClpP protease subunit